MLSFDEFLDIGREYQEILDLGFLARLWHRYLFVTPRLTPRMRAGYVLRIIKDLELPPATRILDAGCGSGELLLWLATHYPGYVLYGIDSNCDKVRQNQIVAQKLQIGSRLIFKCADLSCTSLPEKTYDLIVSIDVLEHIFDDMQILHAFRTALKLTGVLILHVPLRHQEQRRIFPFFKNHVVDSHVRDEYLPEEIRAKLKSAGFRIHDVCYGFGWRGELAFELNTLFWNVPPLRKFLAWISSPLAWYLAYQDVNMNSEKGNSIIALAVPDAYSQN
jgi:2-polyprenyl-3-methyl-5-hydroxy-6-metoxy-1,4-benzoquinol methylase